MSKKRFISIYMSSQLICINYAKKAVRPHSNSLNICDESAVSDKIIENTSISKVPGWRDSRPDDRQRCASAVCDRRNSRRRTREDSRRWSTCTRRPTRSWQSSSKRRAAFPGSHSMWWKSWASLLHLKYNWKQRFYLSIRRCVCPLLIQIQNI